MFFLWSCFIIWFSWKKSESWKSGDCFVVQKERFQQWHTLEEDWSVCLSQTVMFGLALFRGHSEAQYFQRAQKAQHIWEHSGAQSWCSFEGTVQLGSVGRALELFRGQQTLIQPIPFLCFASLTLLLVSFLIILIHAIQALNCWLKAVFYKGHSKFTIKPCLFIVMISIKTVFLSLQRLPILSK